MIPRPDLRDPHSPPALEVFQLTTEPLPSCHIYMEAQIFTPDSRRLVIHRSAHAHGSDRHDPEHRYLLVDLDAPDHDNLRPLTDEVGPTGPAISPDGRYFYYFVDQTDVNAGRLTLKRVRLDGTGRETICVVDAPLPGAKARFSHIYPLSSISSDGRRIATCGFLGDGRTNLGPWGMVVFDIDRGGAELVLAGESWCNIHPQYCRSADPEAAHDILVQENHGNVHSPDGKTLKLCGGRGDGSPGADIHVVKDDGSNFRNLPWGRDGQEYCQGHQCWRGRTTTAVTSATLPDQRYDLGAAVAAGGVAAGGTRQDTGRKPGATREDLGAAVAAGGVAPGGTRQDTGRKPGATGQAVSANVDHLVEGRPAAFAGHLGALTPGGQRNVLSRSFAHPGFYHFASDIAGQRFITDAHPRPARGCDLYLAGFGRTMEEPLRNWTYLLDTRTAMWKAYHAHPFLSPDGRLGFFNSDESGQFQAYMVRGLPEV